MRFIEVVASRIKDFIGGLRVVDYCVCLRAAYVVVSDGSREALGMAHIPHEDLHELGDVVEPAMDEVGSMVLSVNPINRALGLALINAVAQYHLGDVGMVDFKPEPPVCVVGYMKPLVDELIKRDLEVYVFERSPYMRGNAYSDVEEELLVPKCGTVYITGMAMLNFTIDRILGLSRGVNVLIGPSASLLPELISGLGVHYIESIKFTDIDRVRRHLRLGGYVSLKVHSHLGLPYRVEVY